MKLITWNVQWCCGLDGKVDPARIVAHARSMADFDVLCVQEVADNFPAPRLAGNDERDQFAELARLLPGYRMAEGIAVDVAGDGGRRRRFGNAIFTRYSLLAVRRHALPWPADAGKDSMPRVAVEATLQTGFGPLRVTTTHLEYYSDVQRRAQALRLRVLHEEACHRAAAPFARDEDGDPFDPAPQTGAAILTGDFNFPPDNPAYAEIQATGARDVSPYRDAWTALNRNVPHAPTFCVHDRRYSKTPYCCDFVFASEDIVGRLRRIEVDTATRLSDHQPVLIELDGR
jgi:endonuclease/exonuclease/phosphatase family metal-dependent hydrolase